MLLILLNSILVHADCTVNEPVDTGLFNFDIEELWWSGFDLALAKQGMPLRLSTIIRGSFDSNQVDDAVYDAIGCLNDAMLRTDQRINALRAELEDLEADVEAYRDEQLRQHMEEILHEMLLISQKLKGIDDCSHSWCRSSEDFKIEILNEASTQFLAIVHYIEQLTTNLDTMFECDPVEHSFTEYEHWCICEDEEEENKPLNVDNLGCRSTELLSEWFFINDNCARQELHWQTTVTECRAKYNTVYIPHYLKPLKHAVAVVMTLWMEITLVGSTLPNIDLASGLETSPVLDKLHQIGEAIVEFHTATRDHSFWRNYGGTNFDQSDNDGWFTIPGDENYCPRDFGYSGSWQVLDHDCHARSDRDSYCGEYGTQRAYATCVQSTAPVLPMIETQLDDMLNDFAAMYTSTMFESMGNGRCGSSRGKRTSAARTLEECQSTCVSDANCNGIEWYSRGRSTRKCKHLAYTSGRICRFIRDSRFISYRLSSEVRHDPISSVQGTWDPWADAPYVVVDNENTCEDNGYYQIKSAWECMMAAEALNLPTGSGMDNDFSRDNIHGGCLKEVDQGDVDFNIHILSSDILSTTGHSDRRAICKKTAGTARRALAEENKTDKSENRLAEVYKNEFKREE